MTKSRTTSRFSKFLSLANSIFLLVPLLLFQVVTSSPAHAAACSAGTVTVNPLHSPDGTKRIFYGDLKGGSTVRSSYVGWELTGASGILGNDIWIKLTGINSYSSSGNLRLGQYQDSIFPVRGTSSNGNPQVYAYLTAFTATNTDFDFTVSIYNGYPYASNTAVCEYADGFTQIIDTISASSNTVTSVSISSPIVLGSSFTVTAQGSTGTMGSGEVNDRVSGNGPIVLSPSASDSFRSDAFQLIGVSIAYGGTTYRDELRTYPTTSADTPYTATYTFQVRGVPGSSTTLTPIQSIASGANVKYTGTTYAASISNPTNPLSTTKSVVSKTGTTTPWTVKYKVVISNSGSTSIVVDRVVDAPSAGSWTYISNSTTLDGVAFPDTRVTTSGGKLYFGGPLTVSGNSSITIIYDLSLTASNTNTVGAEYAGGVALGSTSITVNPTVTLTLSPNSPLTSGVVGTSYSQTFSTTGGTSPYTYALASGTLPTGLSLSGATLSGTPTVAGTYSFTIRSTDANNAVVTKDYTLEIKATVTYNGNSNTGGSAPTDGSSPYSVGNSVTVLSNSSPLTRTNYVFTKWNTQSGGDGTDYLPGATFTMSTSNVILYAQWTYETYTVTYQGNGNTGGSAPSAQTKTYGTPLTLSTKGTLTKTGYTFTNWNTASNGSGTTYGSAGNYTANTGTTLYAQWSADTLTVTYNENGGTTPSGGTTSTHTGETLTTLATTSRAGYTLNGWFTSASGGLQITTSAPHGQTASFTLYAQWSADSQSISYNKNHASATGTIAATTGNTDASVTLSSGSGFTRSGYTLSGWNTQSGGGGTSYSKSEGITMPAGGLTLYAQWSADDILITFDSNTATSGTVMSTLATKADSLTVLTLNTYTKSGFNFLSWTEYADGSGTSYVDGGDFSGLASKTLYAQWTDRITVRINYFANDGSGSDSHQNAIQSTTVTLNANPFTRSGYSFLGWSTDSGTATIVHTESETVVGGFSDTTTALYAQWSADSQSISYNKNHASATGTIAATTGNTDASVTLSSGSGFTRSGYTLSGWNTQSGGGGTSYSKSEGITMPAGGLTLYAQWSADSQSISYNKNHASATGTIAATTGNTDASVTLSSGSGFTRSGYTLSGWNTQSGGGGTSYSKSEGITMPAGGLTLYAQWSADDILITFDSNTATSGSMSALNTKADSATVLTSNGFTKSGYSFQYWTEDSGGTGTQYTDASSYSSLTSITLYAQWSTSTTTYTITYDTSTATSGSTTYVTQTYTVGGATLTLNPQGTLARTGYTFGGWKNGVTTYTTAQTGVTLSSSITLEPIWTGITYTVTYNGNGNSSGSAPTSQSFTYGSGSVTISSNSGDLKKSSYTFSTWNTSSAATGTTYAPGATYSGAASITLYAVWDQNSKRSQSISLSGGTLPYLSSTTLRSTGYSGTGSISYSLNSGDCSISGGQLTAQGGLGSCIVTVTIAADSTYNSASNNATFTLVKANQVISFTQPRNMLVGESRQSLTYSASSGLPVTLSINSSGICSVYTSGTDPEKNGTCSITASQGGNANYNPAISVTVTYAITSIVKKQQNLVFNQPAAMLTSDPGQKLFYFSMTTVPINVTVNTSSICNVRDGLVYPISAGQCSITVSQNGTVEYEPASITRIFNIVRNQSVAKRQYTLNWSNPAPIYEGTPLTSIQLNAEASISGTYEYTPTFGVKLPRGTYKLLVLFSPTDLGTYTTQTTSVTLIVRAGTEPIPTSTGTPKASPTPSSTINPLGNGVVTVATNPVTTVITQVSNAATVSVPTPSSSPSPTFTSIPSISPSPSSTPSQTLTPVPSATRTSTPNPNSSNSASPNSSQAARPTPAPTPGVIKPTPGVTAAPLPTPSVASATPKPSSSTTVVNQGQGIDQVTTSGKEVTVVAEEGYSGKTTVTVTVQDSGQSKKVVIPVTVLPLPAKNPTYQLLSLSKTIVHWGQSDNSDFYRVQIDGNQVCSTQELSCTLNKAYGQNNKVEIISVGGDNLTSKAPAVFDKSQPFLLTVVNFDTAKYSLTTNAKSLLKDVATKVKVLGYKNFTIYGFTDIRGGIDNQKLSFDRATSVKNYISTLVPGADFQLSYYGPSYPVAPNTTVEGLAANRRAEIWVTG